MVLTTSKWDKINCYFNEKELQFLTEVPYLFVKAIAVIGRVYAEQKDKSGAKMVGHFIRVSENFEAEDLQVVSLLHDIVEDGYITFNDLLLLNFPTYIVETVIILTRYKSVYPDYDDYITSIIESNNEMAIQVKYADMLDNSSNRRIDLLDENTKLRLINKYKTQLPRLEEKFREMKDNKVLERVIA